MALAQEMNAVAQMPSEHKLNIIRYERIEGKKRRLSCPQEVRLKHQNCFKTGEGKLKRTNEILKLGECPPLSLQ